MMFMDHINSFENLKENLPVRFGKSKIFDLEKSKFFDRDFVESILKLDRQNQKNFGLRPENQKFPSVSIAFASTLSVGK